jgi:hypothetical protein
MIDDKKLEEVIAQITKQMEQLINDTSVPRNVRSAIGSAKEKLNSPDESIVRISGAIYCVDAISTDINLPPQARTAVWNILSQLESIKAD